MFLPLCSKHFLNTTICVCVYLPEGLRWAVLRLHVAQRLKDLEEKGAKRWLGLLSPPRRLRQVAQLMGGTEVRPPPLSSSSSSSSGREMVTAAVEEEDGEIQFSFRPWKRKKKMQLKR